MCEYFKWRNSSTYATIWMLLLLSLSAVATAVAVGVGGVVVAL